MQTRIDFLYANVNCVRTNIGPLDIVELKVNRALLHSGSDSSLSVTFLDYSYATFWAIPPVKIYLNVKPTTIQYPLQMTSEPILQKEFFQEVS